MYRISKILPIRSTNVGTYIDSHRQVAHRWIYAQSQVIHTKGRKQKTTNKKRNKAQLGGFQYTTKDTTSKEMTVPEIPISSLN